MCVGINIKFLAFDYTTVKFIVSIYYTQINIKLKSLPQQMLKVLVKV